VAIIDRLDEFCDITRPFGDRGGCARRRLGYSRLTAQVVAEFPPEDRGIVGKTFNDVRNVILEGIDNLGFGIESVVCPARSEGVDIGINAACDNVVMVRA
jgi:hypothetical protein